MTRARLLWGCLILAAGTLIFEAHTLARGPNPLSAAIENILKRDVFAPALVAIDIRDLDTGQVLFERNVAMNVKPASTMKLFTTAAILDAEGVNAPKGETTLDTTGRLDAFGRVLGDAYLIGRGDPNLSDRFAWRSEKNPFDQIAADLRGAGITRIEGRLIGYDGLFPDGAVPDGWTADDLVWSYGAEVSALSAFDNTLRLRLEPGERDGDATRLDISPRTDFMVIENRAVTGSEGSTPEVSVSRPLGSRKLVLAGTVPRLGKAVIESVAVPEPALFASTLLRDALFRYGITLRDGVESSRAPLPAGLRPLGSVLGPSVGEQIRVVNKESQNLHAETLLRRLGLASGDGRMAASLRVRDVFLRGLGVRVNDTAMLDGSGLSRADLVTARAEVDLLAAMARHPQARVFRDSLPIAGVDGSLRNRMKATKAEGRVFAKTGSLRHVNALAGYVDTVFGRHLAFSMIANHHTRPSKEATDAMDEICALLANLR